MVRNSQTLQSPLHVPNFVGCFGKCCAINPVDGVGPVHNQPSGDPTPSQADNEMTRQIAAVAKPLGVQLHDHIIAGRDGHASLKGGC